MSSYQPREDTLATAIDRIEDVREALQSQNRALATMLRNQQLHGEMLAKILEAVTREPADNSLADLLLKLIQADKHHASVLQDVLKAVTRKQPPGGSA
jgi:F0F1-type ATP synthase delta subunit